MKFLRHCIRKIKHEDFSLGVQIKGKHAQGGHRYTYLNNLENQFPVAKTHWDAASDKIKKGLNGSSMTRLWLWDMEENDNENSHKFDEKIETYASQ